MRTLTSVLLLVATLAVPQRAAACSCSYWTGFRSVPRNGATVPANLPAILVQVDPSLWDALDPVTLERIDGAVLEPVAVQVQVDEDDVLWIRGQRYIDVLLIPDAALAEGALYRLSLPTFAEASVEFATGPAAPLPTVLGGAAQVGVEDMSAPYYDYASSNSCGDMRPTLFALLELTLDRVALPWADAMAWETLLDDRDQRQGSYCQVHDIAERVNHVRVDCSEQAGRSVVFRGTVPGQLPLTSEVLTVPCVATGGAHAGCSVAGTGGSTSLALLGLHAVALLFRRRRRLSFCSRRAAASLAASA